MGGLFKKAKEYDYICVPYPQGTMEDSYRFFANHEDIDKILFRGFEDEERTKFLEQLSKIYDGNVNS